MMLHWISTITSLSSRRLINYSSFIRLFSVSITRSYCVDSNLLGNDCDFVELNADKVIDALGNRRSYPRDAFSYFMDVRKHGFRHNVDTHLSILRILCSCGSFRLLEGLLMEVIKSSDEELGFEVSELVDAIMERVEVEGTGSLVKVFDVLVKVYVHLGMLDESIDLLFKTRRLGFLPCVFSCNYLVNRLIEHGKQDMAIAVYQQLKRLGMKPNVYTYNLMIKAFCRKGCLEEAVDVFTEMDEDGVSPNEYSYTMYMEGLCFHRRSESAYDVLNTWRDSASVPFDNFAYDVVVRGFCFEKKISRAEDVFHDMEEYGLTPTVVCYSSLIHACCKSSLVAKAISLQSDMILKGLKINCFIVSAILQCLSSNKKFEEVVGEVQASKDRGVFLDEVCYNIWIDALCKLGKVEEAAGVLEELKHRNMVPDKIHYSTLINGYFLEGKLVEAGNLFQEMKNKGVEIDPITYGILASGFARNGHARRAFGILDYMKARGLTPDVAIQSKIIESLCVGGKVQEAELYLNSLNEKHPENYSAMIKGYSDSKHTLEAFDLFVKTFQLGIVLKKSTCTMLLDTLLREGEIESAFMLFQTFLMSEDDLCIIMYSKLISALCKIGDLKKGRWVFDSWIKRGMTPDAIMYTIMMSGYCQVNLISETFGLFIDMKDRGVIPDVVSYTVLLSGHLKTCLQKSSSSQNLSIRDKAAIVESTITNDMVERKVKPDVVCYTVLIDKRSKLDCVEDAIKLFAKMIENGIQPDTVAYTALLSGFCRVGNVEGARSLIDTMISQGVEPDEITMSVEKHGILKARKMNLKNIACL